MHSNRKLELLLIAPFVLMAFGGTSASADSVNPNTSNQNADVTTFQQQVTNSNQSPSVNSDETTKTVTFNVNSSSNLTTNSSQLNTSLATNTNSSQQISNATYIYNYFTTKGWTPQSVAGMMGNIQSESNFQSNLWQYGGGGGYGLVQWTPANSVISWCKSNGHDYTSLEGQCAYIQYQMTHGLQYYPSKYSSLTANQYMNSTLSPYNLALVFLANFERPANPNQPIRGQQAQYWYQFFQNKSSAVSPAKQQPISNDANNTNTFNQSGTFRVAQGLNVREAPSTNAKIVAYYNGGQNFTYDSKLEANGYLWVSYMSYSGLRRYVAIKNLNSGTTYGYDSNNFYFIAPTTTTSNNKNNPTPEPKNNSNDLIYQSGTFRVAQGLNVRESPSTNAKIVAYYNGGQSFTYDAKITANGYLWVSYIDHSGTRRYVAVKNLINGTIYGYDSNNLSIPNHPSTTITPTPKATTANKAQQVISIARQQIGKPYVWGATGPNSFDCSGLVQYVFNKVGIKLPRTSTEQEYCGSAVNLNNLQPGDLVFWGNYGSAYHVGIYTGNQRVLFAPQPGQTVKEQPMSYYMPSFGRRVL